MKSLALASKPANPRKCLVLGSRTAVFFDSMKMGQGHDQFCFVSKNAKELAKKILKAFIFFRRTPEFLENLRIFEAKTYFFCWRTPKFLERKPFFLEITSAFCPWSLRGSVLGRAVLGLEPYVLDSTSGFFTVPVGKIVYSLESLCHCAGH